jgi:hypothetical protein
VLIMAAVKRKTPNTEHGTMECLSATYLVS